MFETSKFRNENHYFHQLFSSWATKKPVTKVSLARWLISVLPSSGIDTKVFSVHSYRGVSLSTACNNGVTLNDILKVGDWTNADIFLNHYYAHASDTLLSQIILNESPIWRIISLVQTFFTLIWIYNFMWFNILMRLFSIFVFQLAIPVCKSS